MKEIRSRVDLEGYELAALEVDSDDDESSSYDCEIDFS